MPLAMEGPRPLSPLEREAFRLVFWDSIDPCDVYVTVFDDIYKEGGYYSGAGSIQINRSTFLDANLHMNSTHANTDILKPANIRCLSTLIHECTHYWQEVYGRHTLYKTFYDFTKDQLLKRDVPELSANQHASAVQVHFLIAWQLEYRPNGSNVNLTSRSPNPEHNVGPVDRFRNIDMRIHNSGKGTSRIIKYEHIHNNIYNFFGWLLVELRYGWKAVCQGKEPFTKNKRQAWVPTWAGYPS